MTMVDRVASVLYGGNLADCYFPEFWRRKARLCIETMRIPTDQMNGGVFGPDQVRAYTMIVQAALDETA